MNDPHELEPLLRRALGGESQALDDLLGKLRGWARAAGQGTGPRRDGSDVTQEVRLRAFNHFRKFKGRCPSSWRGSGRSAATSLPTCPGTMPPRNATPAGR